MRTSGPSGETRPLRNDGADGASSSQLLESIYQELRRVAQRHMAGERRDHTLSATALVHEAYLRIAGDKPKNWTDRARFYFAASEAMRRILTDHARSRTRIKRGRGSRRVPLNVADLADADNSEEILMLDEAFCRLEQEDADAARVVRLRFYAGLSVDDTAQALDVSPSTVDREWAYARAWLQRALRDD